MNACKGVPQQRYPARTNTGWMIGDDPDNLPACRDHPTPDIFLATDKDDAVEALLVCAVCPVTEQCRKARRGADGVWGGRVYGLPTKRQPSLRDYIAGLHGTLAAARRHQRRGERPCQACLDAQKGRPRKAKT